MTPAGQIAIAALRSELAHLLALSLEIEQLAGSLSLTGPDQAAALTTLQSCDRITQGLRDLLRIADHLAERGPELSPDALRQLAATVTLGQIRSSLTGIEPRAHTLPGAAELL